MSLTTTERDRLERIAVQVLAGYAANASGAVAAATCEKLAETSIRMAQALIKQLDEQGVRLMGDIDWSKAPAGATHFDADPERTPSFMMQTGYQWYFWPPTANEPEWMRWDPSGKADRSCIVPKPDAPPTWNGLPPVGMTVEVLWSSLTGEYVTALVVGHDEGRAVTRFTNGERKGEYQATHLQEVQGHPSLRPIRTAEQLAAEERERQCLALAAATGLAPGVSRVRASIALYDAGARMPGEGAKA